MAQEHKRAGKRVEEHEDLPAARGKDDTLADDVDALLDEIDEVLEDNAEEFVRCYVQKGGQ